MLLTEGFNTLLRYGISLKICLIGEQHHFAGGFLILVDLLYPEGAQLLKRKSITVIKNENNRISSPVISRNNRLESFRASSVPNLQFYPLSIYLNSLELEVYSDCGKHIAWPAVFHVPQKQGAFTHSLTPSYYYFVSPIIIFQHFILLYSSKSLLNGLTFILNLLVHNFKIWEVRFNWIKSAFYKFW